MYQLLEKGVEKFSGTGRERCELEPLTYGAKNLPVKGGNNIREMQVCEYWYVHSMPWNGFNTRNLSDKSSVLKIRKGEKALKLSAECC